MQAQRKIAAGAWSITGLTVAMPKAAKIITTTLAPIAAAATTAFFIGGPAVPAATADGPGTSGWGVPVIHTSAAPGATGWDGPQAAPDGLICCGDGPGYPGPTTLQS